LKTEMHTRQYEVDIHRRRGGNYIEMMYGIQSISINWTSVGESWMKACKDMIDGIDAILSF
jgi:hypothetical protein